MADKQKIVLLNPPGDKLYSRDKYCSSISKAAYYWEPIDLLVLSGILGNEYSLKVIDAIIDNKNAANTLAEITAFGPDAVVSLTSSSTWIMDFIFLEKVKKATSCKIILSGGIVLTKSRYILEKHSFIDACLLDFTTLEIVNYLKGEGNIFNMVYREGGKIVESERNVRNDFEIPVPKHELFHINKYRYPISIFHPITCIISSLGCPFKCSFCVPSTIKFRSRNIENTIAELKHIQDLGIKEVVFQDSTFTVNKDYAKRLCAEIIKNKIKLSWICLTRVDCIDEEMLRIMKNAGCHSIEFGVETGDETVMKAISKGLTKDSILNAFRLCRKLKIKTCAFFILGLPGQDKASVESTIDFALEVDPDIVSFSLPMPHYGTQMGENVLGSDNQLWEFSDDRATKNVNNEIPMDELLSLRNEAYKRFYFRPGYILRQLFMIKSVYQFRLMFTEFLSLVSKYIGNSVKQ